MNFQITQALTDKLISSFDNKISRLSKVKIKTNF